MDVLPSFARMVLVTFSGEVSLPPPTSSRGITFDGSQGGEAAAMGNSSVRRTGHFEVSVGPTSAFLFDVEETVLIEVTTEDPGES